MAANNFTLKGKHIENMNEFFGLTQADDAKVSDVNYMPDELKSSGKNNKFKGISFYRVSFARTEITGFKFFDCIFEECLFLQTNFHKCEFSNCKFKDSNFMGASFKNVRLDPKTLEDNFSFKEDANIAVHTFQSLYACMVTDHQPDYARLAKYYYLHASKGLNRYYLSKGRINKFSYHISSIWAFLHDHISGYGVLRGRLLRSITVYLVICTLVNWLLSSFIFQADNAAVQLNFFDSLYYTFVTITTIGFGDITPATLLGRMLTVIESAIGIILIAMGLNIFTNGDSV